jgi:ABC-type sugar transport system ATPase subunit
MVEIARALHSATRVVVMDEPTAMLSQKESDELFRIIGELRARGLAIVYISHRMEELSRIADRITILRDGRRVYSSEFAGIDTAGIIRHMVAREIRDLYPEGSETGGETILEVRGLGDGVQYRNVSFKIRRGEILGLAGLVGAGRTALARGLFGLDRPLTGSVYLNGREVRFRSSREAIDAGLAYLTEDRKITSLFPHLSLVHNISIAGLAKIAKGPVLRLGEEARRCSDLISRLHIRTRSEAEPVYRLSGGNQQKSLIARWLFAGSSVLVLDEPTQGVDVGARAEIYRLIRKLASDGAAILMISSDLPELLGMSHRIAVMRRGELVAFLDADGTNQEEIMRHAALVH